MKGIYPGGNEEAVVLKPLPTPSGRCTAGSCRKKLGLTGFTCKCGKSLCTLHRLPEDHACEFDHKAIGRLKIANGNPVIIASKIDRI